MHQVLIPDGRCVSPSELRGRQPRLRSSHASKERPANRRDQQKVGGDESQLNDGRKLKDMMGGEWEEIEKWEEMNLEEI